MSSCSSQLDPATVFQEAIRATDEGRYEEALSHHVWYHEHALSTDRSHYGVRLSFALADWVRLGQKYPPALDKLKSIRSDKTAQILSGRTSRELFHDVKSINEHLGDQKATVDLFKSLDSELPLFAKQVYELAEESLVNQNEFFLASKYITDPVSRLKKAQSQYLEGMKFAATSRNKNASKQAFESIFVNKVVRLLVVLRESNREDDALAVGELALQTLDAPEIRAVFTRNNK